MKSKITPQIRFEHFTDQWQEVEFGSIYEVISGYAFKVSDYVQDGIPIINGESIQHGYINTRNLNFLPQHFADSYKKSILETGDIVLGLNRPIINGRLKIAQIPEALHGSLLYQRAGKIVRLNDTHVDFTYQLLINVISNFVEKKAVGSDQPFISTTLLKKWLIHMPLLEREQEKIGNFLKSLDDSIALQQQELTILKQTKQGFLQKMFPKEGEAVPEVRFPGFTESWKYSRIGEITESYSGGTPSAKNKLYYGGIIPFIRSGEINASNTELFLTESGFNNSSAKIVEKGDILYALYGATSGEVGISQINGAINQAILAIKPKSDNNSNFIMQWLKRQQRSIISTYLQGGQGNLSGSIVKDLIIPIPQNIEEQVVIGTFFKQLDKVITLHEQELEALQQTKKAFLQKMFV
ncbi:restriction endonuclease subunit S [Sporosarcina ureae]|uniref:restriction endonuclease subunit S n=1 Tax=Sporosarcina ureae TaxID=1571 RepID=UPI000A17AB27|nr:restriction endonuclease subunit S [Sporosarcina ureae]ARK20969.1 restriction endonuclease subunit S [Sporosarcina ureae]